MRNVFVTGNFDLSKGLTRNDTLLAYQDQSSFLVQSLKESITKSIETGRNPIQLFLRSDEFSKATAAIDESVSLFSEDVQRNRAYHIYNSDEGFHLTNGSTSEQSVSQFADFENYYKKDIRTFLTSTAISICSQVQFDLSVDVPLDDAFLNAVNDHIVYPLDQIQLEQEDITKSLVAASQLRDQLIDSPRTPSKISSLLEQTKLIGSGFQVDQHLTELQMNSDLVDGVEKAHLSAFVELARDIQSKVPAFTSCPVESQSVNQLLENQVGDIEMLKIEGYERSLSMSSTKVNQSTKQMDSPSF